ncbi:hypothetical protein LCGC14_1628570, partial [marine sediment metagenome]
ACGDDSSYVRISGNVFFNRVTTGPVAVRLGNSEVQGYYKGNQFVDTVVTSASNIAMANLVTASAKKMQLFPNFITMATDGIGGHVGSGRYELGASQINASV